VSFTGNTIVDKVTDIDGNTYNTLTIGTQIWMTENLRVSHYNDGTEIEHAPSSSDWASNHDWQPGDQGAWCWYDNDMSYEVPYGKLYNSFAANSGKLCPAGWRVPSYEELIVLIDYIKTTDPDFTGGKMKQTGFVYWDSPNVNATNSSGWTGLPGGMRSIFIPRFEYLGCIGSWWSATESPLGEAETIGYALSLNCLHGRVDIGVKMPKLDIRYAVCVTNDEFTLLGNICTLNPKFNRILIHFIFFY